jgi:hypothetical protein
MTQHIKDVSRFWEPCKVVRTKMQQIHHVKGCKYMNQANNYKHAPLTINPKLEITLESTKSKFQVVGSLCPKLKKLQRIQQPKPSQC